MWLFFKIETQDVNVYTFFSYEEVLIFFTISETNFFLFHSLFFIHSFV